MILSFRLILRLDQLLQHAIHGTTLNGHPEIAADTECSSVLYDRSGTLGSYNSSAQVCAGSQ